MPSPCDNGLACDTGGITFSVGNMTERAPIHLGSGEPMVLLHPFMMSQNVWKHVAPLIAETGRYEVFAPTMAGHNGGPAARSSWARPRWPTTSSAGWTRWAGAPPTSSATRWAAGWRSSWSAAAAPAR